MSRSSSNRFGGVDPTSRLRRAASGIVAAFVIMQAGTGCTVFDAMQIQGVLMRQADEWNRGNIDAFMNFYWNSEKLTFSSAGQTRRGWTATRDHFKSRYDTREKMGVLRFSDLKIESLSPNAAYVLGRWDLVRTAPDKPVGGVFTLVVAKLDNAWRIIHDHTSVDAPK
ncbi:MAG: nuclear transport factor 2 family protein [Phycisphaerae bacterium]|nr:nuclear transport factor 2 family protein [Phycisphaerae bacterium]